MAKIVRISPKEDGVIRIEMDITHKELMQAHYYKPESLEIRDGEASANLLYKVVASNQLKVGRYGMEVPIEPHKEGNIKCIAQFENLVEEEVIAKAVTIQNNLTQIEKQIKAALKELEEAKTKIEEV